MIKEISEKKKHKEAIIWYKKGTAFNVICDHVKALNAYNKAIELKPDYVEAWIKKGNELCALGDYDNGIKAFNKAIELKPDCAEAWYNKANRLEEIGNRSIEASIAYKKAIELNKKRKKF
jgi:tetratricopeptide (TPR) repeat protein